MILTDTHTHLYSEKFDNDREVMVKRAIDSRVRRLFLPNIDVHSIQPMLDLVWKFPGHCFPMMGLHPCSIDNDFEAQLFQIQKWFKKRQFYAVGEIGLDLYWDKSTLDIQKEAFELQCDWAIEKQLPVAIHSRDSTHILIELLKKRKNKPRGVFHCFTGSLEEANEILKLGFYVGIGGVVTYKNTHLRDTLKHLPLDKIVLETDAPYLPPVPFRGKRNESAYTKLVAETLCSVYEKGLEEIAAVTTQNAKDLFGI